MGSGGIAEGVWHGTPVPLEGLGLRVQRALWSTAPDPAFKPSWSRSLHLILGFRQAYFGNKARSTAALQLTCCSTAVLHDCGCRTTHPSGRSRAGRCRPPRQHPGCRCPQGNRSPWRSLSGMYMSKSMLAQVELLEREECAVQLHAHQAATARSFHSVHNAPQLLRQPCSHAVSSQYCKPLPPHASGLACRCCCASCTERQQLHATLGSLEGPAGCPHCASNAPSFSFSVILKAYALTLWPRLIAGRTATLAGLDKDMVRAPAARRVASILAVG